MTTIKQRRIQRKRTSGWRMPEGAVYVGRPTAWGNPFVVGGLVHETKQLGTDNLAWWRSGDAVPADGKFSPGDYSWFTIREITDRADAVALFARFVVRESWLELGYLDMLRGHDLACWCPLDEPCHADALLSLLETGTSGYVQEGS